MSGTREIRLTTALKNYLAVVTALRCLGNYLRQPVLTTKFRVFVLRLKLRLIKVLCIIKVPITKDVGTVHKDVAHFKCHTKCAFIDSTFRGVSNVRVSYNLILQSGNISRHILRAA